MNIEWLSKICDPTDIRPIVQKPWRTTVNGTEWLFATNGHILAAIRGAFGGDRYEGKTDNLHTLLEPKAPAVTVDIAALKEWASDPHWPDDCEICNGTGVVPCRTCRGAGNSTHECDTCGHEHECVCPDCEGDKKMPCAEHDPYRLHDYGLINGVPVNRILLARLIHAVSGKVGLATSDEERPVFIIGNEFLLAIMPVRNVSGADLPTLSAK